MIFVMISNKKLFSTTSIWWSRYTDNNGGALHWQNITNTSMKKYDLINDINVRGSFVLSRSVLNMINRGKGGHIVTRSPPLPNPMILKLQRKNRLYD